MKRFGFSFKLLSIGFLILFCYGASRLYYRLTDDFRIGNITHQFAFRDEWDTPLPVGEDLEKVNAILDQSFFYLGKGAQSYAFVSEDGRYVLKLFKFKHLRPSPFIRLLPSIPPFNQYKQIDQIRKNRKFDGVFSGYKLANDLHKTSSGIIYAHLNQTKGQWREIRVKDKIGIPRKIDLDSVVFVLQDRAVKTREVINRHLQNGSVSNAKCSIRKVFDLYQREYAKGVYDRDHGVMHNTGFVGNKVIHLDVGKFSKEEKVLDPEFNKEDLLKICYKISTWVEKNYPAFHQEIVEDMEAKLHEIYGEAVSVPTTIDW